MEASSKDAGWPSGSHQNLFSLENRESQKGPMNIHGVEKGKGLSEVPLCFPHLHTLGQV